MIKKATKFFPVIGILLFVYIISRIDLAAVKQNFLQMDLLFVLAAFAMTIPSLIVKTLKWKQLVNPFKVNLGWKQGFSAWLVGFFIGLVTPGRIGDLTRALYLREKMKLGSALTTVVMDRLLDIFALIALAVAGLAFILGNFVVDGNTPVYIVAAFLLLGIAAFLFTDKKRAGKFLKPIFNFFVPVKYKDVLKSGFNDFYSGMHILLQNKTVLAKAALLAFVAWSLVFVQYFLLAKAMGIAINFWLLYMILPTVILVEILPISFSGVGTRDATLILFFSFVGLSAASAVTLSLSILVFGYIYSLAGLAVWVKNPIKL